MQNDPGSLEPWAEAKMIKYEILHQIPKVNFKYKKREHSSDTSLLIKAQ